MYEDPDGQLDDQARKHVARLDVSHGRRTVYDAERSFVLLAKRLGLVHDVSLREDISQSLRRGIFTRQPLRQWVWSPALAFVCAVVVAVIGWSAGAHHLARRAAQSALTYTTGKGERANITLPDGNTVALDVASRLEVPADYVAGDHAVHLVGEGVFTVMHHDGAPFTVMTGSGTAQVLGTSFLVRHYATDTTMVVAVRDGKVSVRSLVLTAGQQVDLSHTGAAHVGVADPAQFGFVTGVLAVNGVLLRDAVPELDRWYDADVRLGDAVVAMRRITGGFTAGSLADLTNLLELTFNFRVVRDGRIITLYQR